MKRIFRTAKPTGLLLALLLAFFTCPAYSADPEDARHMYRVVRPALQPGEYTAELYETGFSAAGLAVLTRHRQAIHDNGKWWLEAGSAHLRGEIIAHSRESGVTEEEFFAILEAMDTMERRLIARGMVRVSQDQERVFILQGLKGLEEIGPLVFDMTRGEVCSQRGTLSHWKLMEIRESPMSAGWYGLTWRPDLPEGDDEEERARNTDGYRVSLGTYADGRGYLGLATGLRFRTFNPAQKTWTVLYDLPPGAAENLTGPCRGD